MIPWIESHTFSLGPITFQTWGTLVAAGYVAATAIASRRAKKAGLDPKRLWDMAFWVFLAAMLGARLFHVLFYAPSFYLTHPWDAVDPTKPGYAIIGGFLAGAGTFSWLMRKSRGLEFLGYADAVFWGIPWGCGIGRIGCFLIHDHPGTLSSFVLATKYPDGQSRHDLGLYLSIVGFTIGLIFLFLNRKKRHPGFYLGAFMILDSLARLWLDFYRVVDARYLSLTPTQWLTFPLLAIGVLLVSPRILTNMRKIVGSRSSSV